MKSEKYSLSRNKSNTSNSLNFTNINQGINSNIVSRLFVSLSFAFAIIVSFNAAVYMVLKFRTSARKEL